MKTIEIQEFSMPRMTRRLYREVDEGAKAFWARRRDDSAVRFPEHDRRGGEGWVAEEKGGEVKERPILFNGEMVRAILDWRKTQTRRPMKVQPPVFIDSLHGGKLSSRPPYQLRDDNDRPCGFGFQDDQGNYWIPPLGTIGDRLWVRETFRIYNSASECACYDECKCARMNRKPLYRASDPSPDEDKWAPSIHMPRWASRINLEITGVRVERVQEITEEDAMKEGVNWKSHVVDEASGQLEPHEDAADAFQRLWQSIYSNWDANPWVWVYEFRRMKP